MDHWRGVADPAKSARARTAAALSIGTGHQERNNEQSQCCNAKDEPKIA
jgi:hypothetical protein